MATSRFIPKARNGNQRFFFMVILASNKHFAVNHFDAYELTSSLTSFLERFFLLRGFLTKNLKTNHGITEWTGLEGDHLVPPPK